ncbi:MAG: ATP-binding protein [Verrucomicrobia bacterium]|nr:ATP-binding protein [Verrucomicrobiota bacterium]
MPTMATRFFMILLAGFLATLAVAAPLGKLSLSSLEQRLQEIDGQLAQLANYNLGGGIGAIGSRSSGYETAHQAEWIEIELGDAVPLDQVLLVPAIRRDGINGFQADGFPQAFRLLAGTSKDRTGKVVAEFTRRDGLLPRIAPVVILCHGVIVSWIRIEAKILSRREFDSKYVFQFSEVLAFSGEENVALHKPVKYPAHHERNSAPGWPDSAMVDGFLPYLMAAASGKKSVAYLSSSEMGNHPTLTIDLGASYPLSRLHLHAVDQSDTVPQAFAGDIGIPRVLRVEGANAPDFSDGQVLLELHHDTIYDVGPILIQTFPVVTCRYVRLAAVKLNHDPLYWSGPPRLGFAEIELFSRGQNVALNKPVAASFKAEDPVRSLSSLTDGRNFYGTILPMRTWLNQLALRHELERERPTISAELNQRYVRQKANVTRLGALAAALAFGVVVIVLVNRIRQQRAIEQTRKRIAADLHDELGADLHAIGLLSDLAQVALTAPERLGDLLQRMRSLSERTGKAARHCTNMLEAKDLYGDLVDDMRHASNRILADLEHEIEFEGETKLRQLNPRKRVDLLLFYQESLINIIRHSGATRAHTRLSAADGQIYLTVSDNGRGLNGQVPPSLKRRARLLGADVEAGSLGSDGARIVLRLKRRWFGILQ